MSKANVGHSTYDAVPDINELPDVTRLLAGMVSNEERVAYLESCIDHTEGQRALAEGQYDGLVEKFETIKEQWEGKIAEAESILDRAEDELAALNRELEALGN